MTTITEARTAFYTDFLANYTGVPSTRITFDNEKFDPPEDVSWVRYTVRHFGGGQSSLGGVGERKFSRTGAVFVQIFIPQDEGVYAGDLLAHEARTLLEGLDIAGTTIRTWDAEIRENGLVDGYFMYVVETQFEYFETR